MVSARRHAAHPAGLRVPETPGAASPTGFLHRAHQADVVAVRIGDDRVPGAPERVKRRLAPLKPASRQLRVARRRPPAESGSRTRDDGDAPGSVRQAACHSRTDAAVSSSRLNPLGILSCTWAPVASPTRVRRPRAAGRTRQLADMSPTTTLTMCRSGGSCSRSQSARAGGQPAARAAGQIPAQPPGPEPPVQPEQQATPGPGDRRGASRTGPTARHGVFVRVIGREPVPGGLAWRDCARRG